MSVNDANSTGEVDKNSEQEEPISGSFVDGEENESEAYISKDTSVYDGYAEDNSVAANENDHSLSFTSEDIEKREKTNYFVRVEGAEKRAKAAERFEQKQKEARLKDVLKSSDEIRSDNSKKLREKEAKELKETKNARHQYRMGKIREKIGKNRKKIMLIFVAIALVVAATIVVPIIVGNIQQAEKDDFIQKNKTSMQDIYMQIADGEYSVDELKAKIKELNSDAIVETYDLSNSGEIWTRNSIDKIIFLVEDEKGKSIASDYSYHDYIDGDEVQIHKNGDDYIYIGRADKRKYDTVKEAIEQYVIEKSGSNR